jgi:hypothetical protein
MKKTLWFLMLGFPFLLHAQFLHEAPVGVALFNNATLLPPASFTAVFNQPIHPGISVSYEFGWKKKEYSKWFQDASLGFFNHRYAYKAILLVSKAGYRRNLGHLSLEASVHAGYMHMMLNTDRLVKNDDGTYEARKGFGRPQFVTGAGLGLGYYLGDMKQGKRIFLNYDVRLQMPFVKSYVPLLPNGLVSLGYQFRIN